MTEQPRKANGQFGEKWNPAPQSTPALPTKGLEDQFNDYNSTGAEQERTLAEGLGNVGSALDQVIEIYRQRQERADEQIRKNQENLQRISRELDQLAAQREAIAEELRNRKNKGPLARIKKYLKRNES